MGNGAAAVRRAVVIGGAIAASTFAAPAAASNASLVAFEVAPPPPGSNTTAALLRDVAERTIGSLDRSRISPRRKVVVSLALKPWTEGPVAYAVDATLRDARTGVLIAVVSATSTADGVATAQLRRQVAAAAVRGAVRRAAEALGSS